MPHISHDTEIHHSFKGGRISSPDLRHSLAQGSDFSGLEDDINRYGLLLLVKRVGASFGFSPRMIALLDYYMAFTRDIDWEEGARPIIYQSLSRTALDLGVSERQIQKLEKSLFDLGALTWNDSGNHRRFGQRDSHTGAILYAYGVDLTPLAYLQEALEEKLESKRLHDEAWMETKRQVSWYRRQLRSMIAELLEMGQGAQTSEMTSHEKHYEEIAVQIRAGMSLERLEALRDAHKAFYERLSAEFEDRASKGVETSERVRITPKSSPKSDKMFTHNKNTNKKPSDKSDTSKLRTKCFQGDVMGRTVPQLSTQKADRSKVKGLKFQEQGRGDREDLILSTGLQHITLKQVLNASSGRFKDHLPLQSRPMDWNDVVEASYALRSHHHISQKAWGEGCSLLGRTGAAICLMLTDQATLREKTPVLKAGAYFSAMIARAKRGELRLHSSVFGILKREEGAIT